MNKKYIIYGSIALAAGLLGFVIIRAVKMRKAETQNLQKELETIITTENAATVAEEAKIFPLKRGTKNEKVVDIQKKLGVTPTGLFGSMTEAAVSSKYKTKEVDKQLYYKIINS